MRRVPAARRLRAAPLTTSFPSGHAASAAAFLTGVAAELPKAAAPVAPLATAVAVSRVYVGVHYPLDVAAGAATGAAVAGLGSALARRTDDLIAAACAGSARPAPAPDARP